MLLIAKDGIKRPNRKNKRLLAHIVANNSDVKPYVNKIRAYNKRVGQKHIGYLKVAKFLHEQYSVIDIN